MDAAVPEMHCNFIAFGHKHLYNSASQLAFSMRRVRVTDLYFFIYIIMIVTMMMIEYMRNGQSQI